jgi:oxaloacetate decarboxylase alpha subunit
MVTPYSQFVGVQATMNVVVGERYREVSDEVIQYALGFWGEEEAASMHPNTRDRILDRARAREVARWHPAEVSVPELRRQFGGPAVSDDDLLLRYFSSDEDVASMKAAGSAGFSADRKHPILMLIEALRAQNSYRRLEIRKRDLLLRLGKTESRSGI